MPKRPKRRLLDTLSTRQLAQAIGVSESSVKRWVDDGALSAVRTVGRHRRIPVAEAMRFVRDTSAHLVRPAALGLAAGAISAVDGDAGDTADRLTEWLLAGAGPEVRDLLQGLYLRGRSIAAIIDGPLRTAMRRVGERWRHDPEGVLMEHRATDICAQWLHQLRARLPVDADAPVSVGGAPPGDPYVLPSLAVAAALAAGQPRRRDASRDARPRVPPGACRDRVA
jgi:excisionase family DNA binding protein